MLCAFADDVPCLPDAISSYPAALPSRYGEGGFARNRTMFLVMPRLVMNFDGKYVHEYFSHVLKYLILVIGTMSVVSVESMKVIHVSCALQLHLVEETILFNIWPNNIKQTTVY